MKGLEALEKIDHTICLNNLAKNIVWNIDKEDKIDCENVEQFIECYDIIEKELKALEIIKQYIHISVDEKDNEYCACVFFRFSGKIYVIGYIRDKTQGDLLKEVLTNE